MDPKQLSEPVNISKNQNEEEDLNPESSENAYTSLKSIFIRLEGTHTGATETDALESERTLLTTDKSSNNVFIPSTEAHTSKLSMDANTDPIQSIEKNEKNIFDDKKVNENKTAMKNNPVEEMLQKMNENIQTIMDMFGPKNNKTNESELETPKARKQVSFQGNRNANEARVSTCHRSRYDKFLEVKKSHLTPRHMTDSMEPESNTPDSSQKVLMPHCSRFPFSINIKESESPVSCVVTDTKLETNIAEPLSDTESVNENFCISDFNGINPAIAKTQKNTLEEFIMPMYKSIGGGTLPLAPCEHTFHTLHIEAASSPTSSVMYRPPLCVRFWKIITDFIATLWLCLQVNRDCIFCLGFFVAFLVSASFLTAFFYRTLSANTQESLKIQQQHLSNVIDMRKER